MGLVSLVSTRASAQPCQLDILVIMLKSNGLPKVVSVIIPAYYAAGTLAECLNALQHQQLPPGVRLEIIVVDDHSPDDTVAVALQAGVTCVTAETPANVAIPTSNPEPEWLIWRPEGV